MKRLFPCWRKISPLEYTFFSFKLFVFSQLEQTINESINIHINWIIWKLFIVFWINFHAYYKDETSTAGFIIAVAVPFFTAVASPICLDLHRIYFIHMYRKQFRRELSIEKMYCYLYATSTMPQQNRLIIQWSLCYI